MAVPDFQSFFKPLLEIAADGREHSLREARDRIAKEMGLSQADLGEKLPSGTQTKFDNRVAWAKSYFIQAKVLDGTKRGFFQITERGRALAKRRATSECPATTAGINAVSPNLAVTFRSARCAMSVSTTSR